MSFRRLSTGHFKFDPAIPGWQEIPRRESSINIKVFEHPKKNPTHYCIHPFLKTIYLFFLTSAKKQRQLKQTLESFNRIISFLTIMAQDSIFVASKQLDLIFCLQQDYYMPKSK
jgi:hypothetical protein